MQRIEIGDFLLIAEVHTGIDAKRLARIPRVLSLASAAIATAETIERLASGVLDEAAFIEWVRERLD
jgi:hypothetical protein